MLRKKRLGFTLVEILVAGFCMTFVLVAAYSVFEVLKRSSMMVGGRTDARSQVRAAFNRLELELSKANYIRTDPASPASSIALGGQTFVVPKDDGTSISLIDSLNAGLVVAIPKSPIPDPWFSTSIALFDIVAIKTIPRPIPDSRNPNARSILFLKWIDVPTANVFQPTADNINFAAIGTPRVRNVDDT